MYRKGKFVDIIYENVIVTDQCSGSATFFLLMLTISDHSQEMYM